jgi:hypothetical protein
MKEDKPAVTNGRIWPLYLGDGVYFDPRDTGGYPQVKLYTSDGAKANNVIFLDRYVAELTKWLGGER